MKKFFFFLSAIALLGLTAACVEQREVNPNYDAVRNEVTTAFTINIATKAQTKATAADVQADGSFRGMDKMDLLVATEHPAGAEFKSEYHYQLGTLAANEISEQKSSKIYSLAIPLGVNNMVFYGHATNGGTAPKQYGKISYNVGNTKASTHFDLAPIANETIADHNSSTVAQQFQYRSTVLAAIVNDVMSASSGQYSWQDYAAQDRNSLKVYGYPLWDAYNELKTVQANEHRAGSGAAIVRMLNDLKSICNAIVETGSIVPQGDQVRLIANAINAKISQYMGTTNTFLDMDQLTSVPAVARVYQTSWNLQTGDLRDFPRKLGLPSGAAQLTYSDNTGFSYVDVAQSMGPANTGVAVDKYTFPAELAYWACSPIRVTDQAVTNDDFPTTVTTWANDEDNDWRTKGWIKNGTVGSSTKGVALQNNINYGTALLKTKVAVADNVADNRKEILDRRALAEGTTNTERDQEFSSSDLNGKFTLLGILVGGQPNQVSWNWAPASGASFTNVVYDTYIGSGTGVTVPFTNPVYTMVFDNLRVGSETDDQNVVYVALELQNNLGKDFYGNSNIVRDGGIFYLVGKLDIAKIDQTARAAVSSVYPKNTDGNGYRFPPLEAQQTGQGNDYKNHEVIRVFMQDFATEANFTITSLKGAYVTVPDLRAVEMKFGLSVDLNWKAGLSFDVPLGGN
jgi:hypothetical protein